jgi:hypothetical protein
MHMNYFASIASPVLASWLWGSGVLWIGRFRPCVITTLDCDLEISDLHGAADLKEFRRL